MLLLRLILALAGFAVLGMTFALGSRAQGDRGPQLAAAPAPVPVAPPAAPAPSLATGGGVTLRSVTVVLPTGDRTFPGGAAADAINNNCLACHSVGMVLNQPTLSTAAWQAEVDKMRITYKAPVAVADVPAIVAYLTRTKGTK